MSEYLDFILIEKKPKTEVYDVVTKLKYSPTVERPILGEVKWYGPWRKYCFYPESGMVFDTNCLTDIVVFTQKLMDERK